MIPNLPIRHRACVVALAAIAIMSLPTTTRAQVPRALSYQGVLIDSTGRPKPDGSYSFSFRLYPSASGGIALWTEIKTLSVSRGLFSTVLGDQVPVNLSFDGQYWLSIQVAADPELSPRVPLTSVGYSIHAAKADTAQYARTAPQQALVDSARIAGSIPNSSVSTAKIVDGAVTQAKLAAGLSIPPGGTAGGDLTGTYPNPTIGAGVVSTGKIADNAVTTAKLADGAVTSAKIPTAQVVKSLNGIRDVVTLRAQGGATITSSGDTITINAGTGGGGVGVQSIQNTNNTLDVINPTGPTVTVNVKSQGIGTTQLADNAVTSVKIPTGQVVKSLNTLKDDVTLLAGSNVTITPGASSLTIAASSGLSLPFSATASSSNPLFSLTNTGTAGNSIGLFGQTNSAAFPAAGVRGNATAGGTVGVFGESDLGYGVYGSSTSLVGVHGEGGTRGGDFSGGTYGVLATSPTGWGVWGGTSSNILNSTGVYGVASASSGEIYGVRGIATSSSLGTGVKGEGGANGVVGTSSSVSGVGVNGTGGQTGGVFSGGGYGVFGTGPLIGVWGVTNSTGALSSGVLGVAGAGSGQIIGVRGAAINSANGIGVQGEGSVYGAYAFSSGIGSDGVRGQSNGGGGNGVRGIASVDGQSWGVWGISTTGLAGAFSGNVTVFGTLSKTAGSFKIDHPLDPANKYLYHSFVESPDMMNVYNGNIVLDARGEAVVELATWFEALNKEFRYQLTCIGGFAPVYVAEEIQNNRFKIAGGKAGMKVSWQVTGIRHDAYADKHRIQVEEDKPSVERGHYLHPDVFGQPEEKSIEWAVKPEVMRKMKEERLNPKRSEIPTLPESPQNKDQR